MDPITLLFSVLIRFIGIYLILLTIRILLSWFPQVDWFNPPFSILSQLTDPYLNIFRSLIPPLGGIDFSPILGFLLLQFLQSFISSQIQQVASGSGFSILG